MRRRRSARTRRLGWSAAFLVPVLACLLPAPLAAQQSHDANGAPRGRYAVETNEDLQPAALPPLPTGMTVGMLVDGDRLFHGKGGCFACHGAEGQGLPAAGDGITSALSYARHEWRSIDSLITAGMPDALSRSPIAMPARGARGDLTRDEIERVAAYVWAISGVRGEPWPGGHPSHAGLLPPGSTVGTTPDQRAQGALSTRSREAASRRATGNNQNHQARP